MKYIVVLLSCFLCIGCATVPNGAIYSLEEAIQISAENMGKILERNKPVNIDMPDIDLDLESVRRRSERMADSSAQKLVIAILNFSSQANELAAYVIEELTLTLANNDRYIIVDRKRLDLIRQEENFQMSGEVSDESAQAIGKKLGAQYVITGSLLDMNDFYRFRMMAINVETAAISAPTSINVNYKDRQIASLLSRRREQEKIAAEQDVRQRAIQENEQRKQERIAAEEDARQKAMQKKERREENWNERKNNAYRNYINIAPITYAWDNTGRNIGGYLLFGGGGLGFHFSPVPFINTGFEFKYWLASSDPACGLNTSIGFVFPLSYNEDSDFIMSVFGDGVIQIGNSFDNLTGIMSENATPAFDAGLVFWWNYGLEGWASGFELKYQMAVYENNYTNEISISWVLFGGERLRVWND